MTPSARRRSKDARTCRGQRTGGVVGRAAAGRASDHCIEGDVHVERPGDGAWLGVGYRLGSGYRSIPAKQVLVAVERQRPVHRNPVAVRVEVQEADGKPAPGFMLDDCSELMGNEIERAVTWRRGGGGLSSLAGKPLRLRFVMKDADLFAMRFAPAKD